MTFCKQSCVLKENEGTRKGFGRKEDFAKKFGRRFDDDMLDDFGIKTRLKADDATRRFRDVSQVSGISAKQSAYHTFSEIVRNELTCNQCI